MASVMRCEGTNHGGESRRDLSARRPRIPLHAWLFQEKWPVSPSGVTADRHSLSSARVLSAECESHDSQGLFSEIVRPLFARGHTMPCALSIELQTARAHPHFRLSFRYLHCTLSQ